MIDLQKLLSNYWSHKTDSWKLKIVRDWPIIIGNLYIHARVEKVYDDALLLGAYDTCWMQELHLLSNMIIKKINLHLGHPHIQKIYLKYVQKHEFNQPKALKSTVLTPTKYKLSTQEQIALTKINDPELRNAISQFLERCHREI